MKKLVSLGLLAFAACGDSGAFDDAATEFEGIYTVSAYTRNEAACAPGGDSQLGNERFAVAFTQTIFGHHVLSVTSCASALDCRAKLADMRAGEGVVLDWQFAVDEVAGDALASHGASTGFGSDGVCHGGEVTATRVELIGTQLRIEQAITIADDYPQQDGFCSTDLAQKNAEGNTCSQMEVLTAELLEVL